MTLTMMTDQANDICPDCQEAAAVECANHRRVIRYVYVDHHLTRTFCQKCYTPIQAFWRYCPMCGEAVV